MLQFLEFADTYIQVHFWNIDLKFESDIPCNTSAAEISKQNEYFSYDPFVFQHNLRDNDDQR